MKKLLLTVSIISLSATLLAQTEGHKGSVYLKNGSIIKGSITGEDENGNITIQSGNDEFEYEADEIKKVRYQRSNDFNRRGYIGLSAGPSFAVGDFYDAGAGAGIQLSAINAGYLFNDYFGITATLYGGANADMEDYSPWSYGGVLAGPMFSLPICKRLSLDLRAMAGYAVTQTPDFFWPSVSQDATSLALAGSALLRVHMSSRVSLLGNVQFFYANPEFYDFSLNVTTISAEIGVAYRFGKSKVN